MILSHGIQGDHGLGLQAIGFYTLVLNFNRGNGVCNNSWVSRLEWSTPPRLTVFNDGISLVTAAESSGKKQNVSFVYTLAFQPDSPTTREVAGVFLLQTAKALRGINPLR